MITLKEAFLALIGNTQIKKTSESQILPHLRLNLCNLLIILQNVLALFGTALINSHNTMFF